jgi:preprotein translocase SecE subunit
MREKLEQFRAFLLEVNQEARRISWPRPREIAGATVVVLIAGVIVAGLLFVYDGVISVALHAVLR